MRACGVVALLILSAVLVSQTEGWFFKSVWSGVKAVAKKVVEWVRNHCSIGIPSGFSCSLGRRKRDVNDIDPNIIASENALCEEIMQSSVVLAQGFSFALVKDIFEEVDGGNKTDTADDVLDEQEFEEFMESLEVFHYCFLKTK